MVANTFRFIFIPILLSAFTAEARQQLQEDALKINYVLQLTKFIQWPAISLPQSEPIELCVFKTTQSLDSWQKIHLQESQNRKIHLRLITIDKQLSQCNVVFIHKLIPNSVIKKNYQLLISNNILTIGEKRKFAEEGGMIEINQSNGKVDIKINTKTATDTGLSINANLIELASSVYPKGQI